MKRKILFVAVIMALLACIFAITAYASEIPEWTSITEVAGMPDKSVFGNDGKSGATSRVLMSDGITYPAYYICKNSTSLGISFSDLNSKASKSYTAKDVVRIELPMGLVSTPMSALKTETYTALKTASFPEGFTTLGSYTFKGVDETPSALVSVHLPSTLTTIEQYAFVRCVSLEELIIPEGVTAIPKEMASYASSLKRVVLPSTITTIGELAFRSSSISDGIVIPEGCTTIASYVFKESGVTSVTLPSTIESVGNDVFYGCKSLTTVDSKSPIIGYRMFYDCDALTTVLLENTVEIGEQGFCNPSDGVLNITELVLPEGLTSIGKYAFTRSKITSLVLPSTLTTMGSNIFAGSTTLQKVVALNSGFGEAMFMNCSNMTEVVLTENFKSFGKDAFSSVSQTSFITYYTGTDYERIKTVCANTTRLSQAKYYTYEDYLNENYSYNKFMVIYDANLCEVAFNGVHLDDSNPCVINCTRCGVSGVAEANPVHNDSVSIAYPNGFDKEGAKITGCSNEGCKHSTSVSFPAIFECLGYSTRNGDTGIATGFSVNYEALNAYKDLSQDTIGFGMVVFNPSYIGETFFDANGKINATKGAIQIEFSEGYSTFNAYVAGFDLSLESHQKLELVFAGYFYTKADKSDIELFQKEYAVSADPEKPNYSPMQSKITKGDAVAYTVKIQTVTTPTLVTTGKDGLDEYGA